MLTTGVHNAVVHTNRAHRGQPDPPGTQPGPNTRDTAVTATSPAGGVRGASPACEPLSFLLSLQRRSCSVQVRPQMSQLRSSECVLSVKLRCCAQLCRVSSPLGQVSRGIGTEGGGKRSKATQIRPRILKCQPPPVYAKSGQDEQHQNKSDQRPPNISSRNVRLHGRRKS